SPCRAAPPGRAARPRPAGARPPRAPPGALRRGPRAAGRMAAVATWPSPELTTLAADEPSHIDRRLVRAVHTPTEPGGRGQRSSAGTRSGPRARRGVGLSRLSPTG